MKIFRRAFINAYRDLKLDWKEISGDKSNPKILECYETLTDLDIPENEWNDDEISWCAAYMWKKLLDAGETEPKRSGMARSFLKYGKPVTIPIQGCIVVLERGNDGVSGHVGFFIEFSDDTRRKFKLLAGNQSDQVCIKEFSVDSVLGYRISND